MLGIGWAMRDQRMLLYWEDLYQGFFVCLVFFLSYISSFFQRKWLDIKKASHYI